MGHCCQILTFSDRESKTNISRQCGTWADRNCDHEENPSGYEYLDVRFTDLMFESFDDASSYLEGTFGNYRQIAVRYRKYPPIKDSKIISDLEKRRAEYQKRIDELDKPHYRNVTQATVKCKNCGSSIATKYCGKSYNNFCPVCGSDLRPESLQKKRDSYCKKREELKEKLIQERKKENSKRIEKAEIMWAVACEVHC